SASYNGPAMEFLPKLVRKVPGSFIVDYNRFSQTSSYDATTGKLIDKSEFEKTKEFSSLVPVGDPFWVEVAVANPRLAEAFGKCMLFKNRDTVAPHKVRKLPSDLEKKLRAIGTVDRKAYAAVLCPNGDSTHFPADILE